MPLRSGRSFTALAVLALLVAVPGVAASIAPAAPAVTAKTFSSFANQPFVACARAAGQAATVTVTRGGNNDSMTVKLAGFPPNLGFEPDASLAPLNTLHVGFWFDSTAEARPCGATTLTPTPFNGEHTAGPLAFISRPKSTTGLGPLCSRPVQHAGVSSCEP